VQKTEAASLIVTDKVHSI